MADDDLPPTPTAMAIGMKSFDLDAISRTPSKRRDSTEGCPWPWATSDGRDYRANVTHLVTHVTLRP